MKRRKMRIDELGTRLLLLALPQSHQRNTRHLDDLEFDTGNITL